MPTNNNTNANTSGTLGAIPWATIIVVLITIVGGVVVIANPETLTFAEYVKHVSIAWAGLAIGRGLAARTVS